MAFWDPDGRKIEMTREDKKMLRSHLKQLNDKSLLRDYKQLKKSPITYYIDYDVKKDLKLNEDQFGIGTFDKDGKLVGPNYWLKASEFDKVKDGKVTHPFIKYNSNQKLNGKYSRVVNEGHELKHAALFDACVRHFDMGDNSQDDQIPEILEYYKNHPGEFEEVSGAEHYFMFYSGSDQGSLGQLRAIEQETKIARDQGEIGDNQVTRTMKGVDNSESVISNEITKKILQKDSCTK